MIFYNFKLTHNSNKSNQKRYTLEIKNLDPTEIHRFLKIIDLLNDRKLYKKLPIKQEDFNLFLSKLYRS